MTRTITNRAIPLLSALAAAGIVSLVGLAGVPAQADQLESVHTIYYGESWESGDGDWYADGGIWEVGTPTFTHAHDGARCAGTNIDGNYPDNASSRFISPVIDLPTLGTLNDGVLWLRFFHLWSYSDADNGRVDISVRDGGVWGPWETVSGSFAGSSAIWSQSLIDITAHAGQTVRFGLRHTEGGTYEGPGWYVDAVEVVDGAFRWNTPETFEANVMGDPVWGGWYTEQGVWEIGEPTSGPGGALSGRMCAATVLAGNYPDNQSSRFVSPELSLPASPLEGELWLSAIHYYHLADSDYGKFQIKAGDTWVDLSHAFYGYSGGWTESIMDLAPYAGQVVRLGLFFGEGGSYEGPGWYVDDIAVVEGPRIFNNPDSFETGTRGWYASDGVWQVGEPTYGPAGAFTGTMCWGTNLGGNYPDDNSSVLFTPDVTLPGGVSPLRLDYQQWYVFSDSDYGEVWVYPEGGEPALISDRFTTTSDGWHRYYIDLTPWAGQTVHFGFKFQEGGSYEGPGWYIDDVRIDGMDQSEPMAPFWVTTEYSAGPPVVNWTLVPYEPHYTCIYASRREDAYLPNLGNRIAMFRQTGTTYEDIDRPGWGVYFYQVGLVDDLMHESQTLGSGPPHTGVGDGGVPGLSANATLLGNTPNPFNPTTVVSFRLAATTHTVLQIFDAAGRRVATLVDAELAPGTYDLPFAAKQLPSGVYFSRLAAGGVVETRKMMLVR
ncbi:MAG: T9SS type A sorting domain-containing protein [Candidatus Krumholzibacteriia bacterium]